MSETPDRKKYWIVRKKPVFIALGVLIVVVAPFSIWIFGELHAANKAFDVFCQKLIATDYDAAYAEASPDFQSAMTKQEFVEQQTTLRTRHGALKRVKRGDIETKFDSSGGFTTIEAIFIFESAERQFTFRMKKVGSFWRVYSYKEL